MCLCVYVCRETSWQADPGWEAGYLCYVDVLLKLREQAEEESKFSGESQCRALGTFLEDTVISGVHVICGNSA